MATDRNASGRQDHYEVLGVASDASEETIRAAYRALAAKYHPDRNPGDLDAELTQKRLNAAFQVLGDPVKRRQYDDLTYGPSQRGPVSDASIPPPPPSTARSWHDATFPLPRVAPERRQPWASGTVLKVGGGLAFLGLCAIVAIGWVEIESQKRSAADQAAVTVEAEYRAHDCGADRPIRVRISNAASKTVKAVAFGLQVFEAGRSNNVAGYSHQDFAGAVGVGSSAVSCWPVPAFGRKPTRDVTVRAEKEFVTFYAESESVPSVDPPRP